MPIEIEAGKLGRQVDCRGVVKEFTPEFFNEVAESYNPSNFKAPAIISHDTKGIPDDKLHQNKELSYGSAKAVKVVGDRLKIVFDKLSPKIKEHFDNGELLSVSPSFYPPTHSANPTPGKWSLRHLSFLGSNPPAIKGLASPEFAEAGYDPETDSLSFSFPIEVSDRDGALEFSIAERSLFSNLRDWLITKHGLEETNKILPRDLISEIAMSDRAQEEELERLRKDIRDLKDKLLNHPFNPVQDHARPVFYMEKKNKMKTKKKEIIVDEEIMEDMDEADDSEDEDVSSEEISKGKKGKKITHDMSESNLDFAELQKALEEERLNRKLLEAQVLNEQRKSEAERENRKRDRINNYCEKLVRDGTLIASQVGDRLLEFGEGEETTQTLPDFLMSLDDEQLAFMEDFLATQPPQISYAEFAPDGKSVKSDTLNFRSVEGAVISEDAQDEYVEILKYCEANSLDPQDNEDFNRAAMAVLG